MTITAEQLSRMPGVWRGGELEQAVLPVLATGHAALDAQLPGGGWPSGTLTEVLHDAAGIGEVSFLAGALARATEGGRLVAWVNAPYLPYAPALAAAGLPPERCLLVRPARREDALWAAEQALKSGACGAVLLWLGAEVGQGAPRPANEYAWLRRLQMAAEAGRSLAVFFRPSSAEGLSTPAHLRVALHAEGGALQVRIPKRRGPPLVQPVLLELGRRPSRRDTPAALPRQRDPRTRIPAALPAAARAFHLVAR